MSFDTANAPFADYTALNFVYIDDQDRVWTGMGGQGTVLGPSLYRYEGGIWTTFDGSDHPALAHGVIAATCDSSGNMWFSVAVHGVLRYDGLTWEFFDTGNSPLLSDWIFDLVTDQEGDIWFACYPGGVVEFDGTEWHVHDHTNAPFAVDFNGVNDLYIDVNNYLYVADNAGPLRVYHQDIETWVVWTPQNSGIPDLYPFSISGDPQGNLFIGFFLFNAGPYVSKWDGAEWTTWFPFTPPYDACGRGALAYDGQGGMLMGSNAGMWRFNGTQWYQEPGSPINMSSSPLCFAVSSTGQIWYCSAFNGLWTQTTEVGLAPTAEHAGAAGLNVSPNPADDHLRVTSDIPLQWIELRDPTGRLVLRQRRTVSEFVLDVSFLAPGTYNLAGGSANARSSVRRVLIH